MRRDWNERAASDPEYYIYTRDSQNLLDFEQSGRANFDQLVLPFLPVLLNGRPAARCRVVEIGCGVGRMTRPFAEHFQHVYAFDISETMVEGARKRLRDCPNVTLHVGSGCDLDPMADVSVDLVFSYIVFQHIPSHAVIENYVREAARVLRPGGAFKFQVNGAGGEGAPDTWVGASFTSADVDEMLRNAGLHRVAAEGNGSQYFVVTAMKGAGVLEDIHYILPGEAAAADQLLEGWGAARDGSWRPINPVCRVRLAPQAATRFFAGIYFWPEDSGQVFEVRVVLGSQQILLKSVIANGDCYLESNVGIEPAETDDTVTLTINPSPRRAPAARVLGFYASRE